MEEIESRKRIISRQRILLEATRLFVNRGYDAVSMREIAETTGISKRGLYYHFVDKEALFLAILNDNLDPVGGILARCQGEDCPTRQRISRAMEEIFRTTPEQRTIIRLASQEMMKMYPFFYQSQEVTWMQKPIAAILTIYFDGLDTLWESK